MTLPQRPPLLSALLRTTAPETLAALMGRGPLVDGVYLHWDDLRWRTPPDGLTREQWWLALRLARQDARRLPLLDRAGRAFSFTLPDPLLEALARIDREGGRHAPAPREIADATTRDRHLQSSLMEEAITSSLLEGAATTRAEAKEMIRTDRPPRTNGERMVYGNYQAMEWVRAHVVADLTPDLVLGLHRVVMESSTPRVAGRFRGAGTDIRVVNHQTGAVLHTPPDASELPARMEVMCAFANASASDLPFVHPVVRAVALHFWLGYDHPFENGNGRTARALFYWSMLRQGYDLFGFVSISALLRKAPARYARSFQLTQTDDLDLTYFLIEQTRVMGRALDSLGAYLVRKRDELRETLRAVGAGTNLNHRQLALVTHALQNPSAVYTIESHRISHRVTNGTARTDLLGLESHELLDHRKVGKKFVFTPAPDLATRLRTLE